MTLTYEARGEVARLSGGDTLAKPKPRRDRRGRWHRDPGAQWDWFYDLEPCEQKYLQRCYMSSEGIGPDIFASYAGTDIDTAMDAWLVNVRIARERITDPFSEEYYAPEEDTSERVPWGYAEISQALGVGISTVHQWMNRTKAGKLDFPPADLVVHGLPTWWSTAVLAWADETGRR